MDNEIIDTWEFPAEASHLQGLRDGLRDVLRSHHIPEIQCRDVVLAVNEACMNIIQHAYSTNPEASKNVTHTDAEIRIEIEKLDNLWCFRLIDSAPTVDTSCMKSRDLDDIRPGGLGMHFIEQIMDDVNMIKPQDGTGNILELSKRL